MLNKEICKRCRGEGGWSSASDLNWFYGNVCCPQSVHPVGSAWVRVKESPPKWCTYALEHIVSAREGMNVEHRDM